MKKLLLVIYLGMLSSWCLAQQDNQVQQLQESWAHIQYDLSGSAQREAYQQLIKQAQLVKINASNKASVYTWRGIIKSSYAGVKGGLGALKLVKQARDDLVVAINTDPKVLQGSAYISLGILYAKVPPRPISFGDKKKAEKLIKKGLAMNPNGIDSNYFYAQLLIEKGQNQRAIRYLKKAQQAAPRKGRTRADAGRQRDIRQALKKLAS